MARRAGHGVGALALADPAQEHAHDFAVKRVLQHAILVAGVDVGIVVDFDHVALLAVLLQVDAVKAVADQVGGANRGAYHDLGRLADRQRDR